jgi:hypothetical protein
MFLYIYSFTPQITNKPNKLIISLCFQPQIPIISNLTAVDVHGLYYVEEVYLKSLSVKRQQPNQIIWATRRNVSRSRRKQNAVKSFRTGKLAKERRHATKSLEKKERRNRKPGLDVYNFACGLDSLEDVHDIQPKNLSEVVLTAVPSVPTPVALAEETELKIFLNKYQLFGGDMKLQLLDNFEAPSVPPPPGLENTVVRTCDRADEAPRAQTVTNAHSYKLPVAVPLLTFHATPNAKTIAFLQQELDILSLLTFSGISLNDIPSVYREAYGTDICLPEDLTPETMLLLSDLVSIYECDGELFCALKSQHGSSGQRKQVVIFFAKQEFQMLSLLGGVNGGLSAHDLKHRFEEKYQKSIILPFGTTLSDVLLQSRRVAISDECHADSGDIKLELIPFLFL